MAAKPNSEHDIGPHIFLCYSHQDTAIVEQEAEWLRHQGFKPWYDDNIAAGHTWSEELAEAISGANAVLYFLTEHSSRSQYCMDELHFAKDKSIPVVSLVVDDVELSPGLQLTLGTKQFVRMHGFSRSVYRRKLYAGLMALSNSGAGPVSPVQYVEEREPRVWLARLVGIVAAGLCLVAIVLLS